MTSSSESQLTSSELRSKLFNSFKSKGVLQSVKTQLRNRIALELQNQISSKQQNKTPKCYTEEGALFLQASNSLIMYHLKQYPYTQSVFMSESLTDPGKLYSIEDILRLLQISPDSKLFHKLTNMSKRSDNVKDGKLLDVERAQLEKFQEHVKGNNMSVEAKVLSFQRKYEGQKRAELKAEMERFRSSELANMRIEEREKCRLEIENAKAEHELYYKRKLKEVESKEEELLGKSSKGKQQLDHQAYEQRQKIFTEMEALKEREMEMKRTHDIALKSVEMQEEKLKLKAEQLKYKEESMRDIEERYETRLRDEVLRVKYDLQQQEKIGAETLHEQQIQLREEKFHFQSQKEKLLRWKEEAEKLKDERQQLNLSLLAAKQTNSSLNQKCEYLAEQCKKVKDFDRVKNDNTLLERDLELMKKKMEEVVLERSRREKENQKLIKELLNKISTGEGSVPVNKEVEDVRLKEQRLREKCQTLQSKYELEVLKNEDLGKLYEDCLLSHRETLREVDDLRTALMITNQEKEKLTRNSKNTIASSLTNIHYEPPSNAYQEPSGSNPRRKLLQENLPDDMTAHMEASEDVFKKLELEALELEKSYKDFQNRQKQSKTPSQVHFNSYIQQRSKSGSMEPVSHSPRNSIAYQRYSTGTSSFDLSRLIPERTVLSYQCASGKKSGQFGGYFSTGLIQNTEPLSSTRIAQPLSSTQAPGASSIAPSFCLSGVLTQDGITKRPPPAQNRFSHSERLLPSGGLPSAKITDFLAKTIESQSAIPQTNSKVMIQSGISSNAVACFSFTQNPLTETTVMSDSLTQHPLYDSHSRNYNTLTQYPLIESDLLTPALMGKNLITPMTKKLETLTEQSIGTDFSKTNLEERATAVDDLDVLSGLETDKKRQDSVEREFELKEASITTFDSPTRRESKLSGANHDVFYTPAASNKNIRISDDDTKEGIVSPLSEVVGTKKSGEESPNEHSAMLSKSSGKEISSKFNVDELNSSKSLSEGEVEIEVKVNKTEAKEEGADTNDVMTQYMKMILQKREEEQKQDKEEKRDIEDSVHDDIPNSDPDVRQISEKSSISEFEW